MTALIMLVNLGYSLNGNYCVGAINPYMQGRGYTCIGDYAQVEGHCVVLFLFTLYPT